ncbi:MAG TPA: hypothetical protein GXX59_08990 [Syntrophomonadaceae bacterium]|nr:hypothetical protein [Syntrophomonadaceae bacterium]
MNKKDEQEKRKIEEHKKHPMINFADSINRSMIGDLESLTKGSCLTRIITTANYRNIVFSFSMLLRIARCKIINIIYY